MNNQAFTDVNTYKIVVFLPKDDADIIIEKILREHINQIDKYSNCLSWGEVTSTWTPIKGAEPYIGKVGSRSVESEIRLEFLCKKENVKHIVDYINTIHPYERAEIDILPLIDLDYF